MSCAQAGTPAAPYSIGGCPLPLGSWRCFRGRNGVKCCCAFWHCWQVRQHLTGSEFTETEGWIQFGGPPFVIRTCQMNVWLIRLPAWVALLYLTASLLGLASWRGPAAARVAATVAIYLVLFLV